MAEEDIYKNKKHYESFKKRIPRLTESGRTTRYPCVDPRNIQYFRKLCMIFEAKDLSYIRRCRVLHSMKFICHYLHKDLKDCSRDDINTLLAQAHETYNTPKSKETFLRDLKHIWRVLFPEPDQLGRPDETIVPYVVRHISGKVDKSRQKFRKDRLEMQEFEKLLNYFSNDFRIQAYISFALESLARPQEILYRKIRDIELHDNYAKIHLSDHGKEGTGILQCIDSFPYLIKWLELHPLRKDLDAYIFINTGRTKYGKQLTPFNINKKLREACAAMKIDKKITCYSLKRSGVTIRRIRGESDVQIQHVARWTSTRQLQTYDLSGQEDVFKLALQKRGLIKPDEEIIASMGTRECPFCNENIGFSETICPKCKHIVDRETALKEQAKDDEIIRLREQINSMTDNMAKIREQILNDVINEINQRRQSFHSLG